MRNIYLNISLILVLIISGFSAVAQEQKVEFKVVSVVESLIPMGTGRSRIIESQADKSYNEFKEEESVKRKDLKKVEYDEVKLLNFFSAAGINFGNIASNDATITAMLNDLTEEGWEILHIVSGVESFGGQGDSSAIFITRFYFKRNK